MIRKTIVISILLSLFRCSPSFADSPIKIAAGQSSGLYYSTAASLCTVLKKETKNECEVVITSGSEENKELLNKEKVNFALMQENLISPNLVRVKKLYLEHLFILYKGAKKDSLQEISKMTYSIDKNSGTYSIAETLFRKLNLKFTPVSTDNLKKEFDDFCDKAVQVRFYNIGYPSDLIETTLLQCNGINIYSLSQSEIDKLSIDDVSRIHYLNQDLNMVVTNVFLVSKKTDGKTKQILEKYNEYIMSTNSHIK